MKRATLLLPGLLCALACGTGEGLKPFPAHPGDYPYAYASRSCAPWDGPAVIIYLTREPLDSTGVPSPQSSFVSVAIWRSRTDLPGASFSWPTSEQIGTVLLCPGTGTCEQPASARVRFRAGSSPDSVDGWADLQFPSGTTVRGRFRAVWGGQPVFCG
jgi:hypothetical protein